jgi:hypothetical protein
MTDDQIIIDLQTSITRVPLTFEQECKAVKKLALKYTVVEIAAKIEVSPEWVKLRLTKEVC